MDQNPDTIKHLQRQLEIEASLERVRAAAMAMDRTEDIGAVVVVFFEQLKSLHVDFLQAWITILHLDKGYFDTWFSPLAGIYDQPAHFKMPSGPFEETTIKTWKSGAPFAYLTFQTREEVDQFMLVCDQLSESTYFTDSQKVLKNDRLEFLEARHQYGFISKTTVEKPSKEDEAIMQRFAKVFEQTYTRFLDLKKAEAQAREAQVEVALERVRARTMAMHKSLELSEIVSVMYNEMKLLGLAKWGCNIMIFHEDTTQIENWVADETISNHAGNYFVKGKEHPVYRKLWNHWKKQGPPFTLHHQDAYKREFDEYWINKTDFKHLPDLVKKSVFDRNEVYLNYATMRYGMLNAISFVPINNKMGILARFAKVFEQAYTRFLDLKKAEAQAREARVEAALERVRSHSMGMQTSEELKDVIQVIFKLLAVLNIKAEHAGIVVDYEAGKDWTFWIADTQNIPARVIIPYLDSQWDRQYTEAKAKGIDFFTTRLSFDEKNNFYKKLLPYIEGLTKKVRDFYLNCPGLAISTVVQKDIGLYIENFEGTPYSEEENDVLRRFGRVFQQTYTRFLDLKNAEAQALEARIDAALEKVRSRSLAMHGSSEMQLVANEIFDQLKKLGLEMDAVGMSGVIEAKKSYQVWVGGSEFSKPLIIPYTDSTKVQREYNRVIKKRPALFTKTYSGKTKKEYIEFLLSENYFPGELKGKMVNSKAFSTSIAFAANSSIQIARYSPEPYSEQENEILKRFSRVFEQAYIRFLDLQKAEAQAREAQIETALERVRSRTMAMQHSDELAEASNLLDREVRGLGIKTWGCAFNIYREKDSIEWFGNEAGLLPTYTVPRKGIFKQYYDKGQRGESLFVREFAGEECIAHYEDMSTLPVVGDVLRQLKETNGSFPSSQIDHVVYFKYGYLLFITRESVPEAYDVFKRFAKVFEQTYTRFLDLQTAEAQALEARIDAALEKIRTRTMAMHHSDELPQVVATLYEQLLAVGIDSWMCVLALRNERTGGVDMFLSNKVDSVIPKRFEVLPIEHRIWRDFHEGWEEKVNFKVIEYSGKEKRKYEGQLLAQEAFQDLTTAQKELMQAADRACVSVYYMNHGMIQAVGEEVLPKEKNEILIRFAKAFEQTYTRFSDLKKAEAQAREATIEAALEKVRSRTMAMQHSDELPEAANVLFLQIQALGIPAWSCGYNILAEDKKSATCWMSSEGVLQKPFTLRLWGETSFDEMGEFIRGKETLLVQELGGQAIDAHYDHMKSFPDLQPVFKALEDEGLSLPTYQINHLCKFSHGFLLFITYEFVPNAQDIFKRFTAVFEQTYTRFLDLQLKEQQAQELQHEKVRLEQTLNDLQDTQTQLIHAEKMASLGELTAGIAHEIKNPLNFVNNFSEVSRELLEELMEEMEKGELEEVKELAGEVIQNLEKIVHHGQRADSIVKGMLQHSRGGDGKKEPTDLNALADEYLRLAYHGLRAKDKSFNAAMETDFDPELPKVKVVPQDIGRVLLNLITNAFYAVNERKAKDSNEYKATVWVKTRQTAKGVEISIRDNGGGIPEAIRDKIFQPFFTTKPTGEGTGLGLSMSYDIVAKGHGGDLQVSSQADSGSEFVIHLNKTLK